ncbi:MAG: hypothetical protein IT462_04080 [Planctomycetes bacterium]|nr:hypothetical protein [Planctomycetota bacterium]
MFLRVAAAGFVSLAVLAGAGVMPQSRAEAPVPVEIQSKADAKTPQQVGREIMGHIAAEDFTKVYAYCPTWALEAAPEETEARIWRMREKWDLWKTLKRANFEGDGPNNLDPKSKSGITDDEEKWLGATDAQRTAVFMGFYRIYSSDDWEKRLKAPWYLDSRNVKLDIEGQGQATLVYRNRYNDSVTVTLSREDGRWFLSNVQLNIPKDLPKKPKEE